MPSMQSTIILATTLLGSLLQHAAAAPEASGKRADIQYPQCISTCMRNSGCFDAKCICSKASDGILSDIVICMNQWCSADITAKDLIGPLEGQCDLPKSAVQDAEKKGGVADDTGDDETSSSTSSTSSAKPTTTAASTVSSKGDDKDDVTVTYDLGKPQTAAGAEPTTAATTVTPATSGTLILPTDAATADGLLTDSDNTPTATGSLGAATSLRATPSSSAAGGDSTGSADEDNAAGLTGQASIFGVVAAMGAALALGF